MTVSEQAISKHIACLVLARIVAKTKRGIEQEATDDAYDVITFEDTGNGQTKLTFIGNETWRTQTIAVCQILDKVAAVVAELARE